MSRTGKVYWLIIIGILMAGVLAGCWDRREINELAIVASAALDLEPDGTRVVTAELYQPPGGGGQEGGGGGVTVGPQRQALLATGRGPNFFEAIRELALKVPLRVYWAHDNAIIVGEALARQGLREVLDLWDRNHELRRGTMVLIARGRAADVIIWVQGGLQQTLGQEITGLNKWVKVNGSTRIPTIHDIFGELSGGAADAVLPVITVKPQAMPPRTTTPKAGDQRQQALPLEVDTARLEGMAYFQHDKLMGWLDLHQSRGLAWTRGWVARAGLEVKCPQDQEKAVVETVTTEHQVGVKMQGGQLRGEIKVKVSGDLTEQGCFHDLTKDAARQEIEKQMAALVAGEIQDALAATRPSGTDVFGFGGAVSRKYPALWQQLQTQWREQFKTLPVDVAVEAHVVRTGLTARPWQPRAR
ncbi:Ger(x)C family spore germination protein [Moorella naiadis]|uniref:Ger(x)C family spore germination protein n=1 Tax=Moorella naiadis (nom. illeg.) TaxID=3093670 RepID=UPI003D9C8153